MQHAMEANMPEIFWVATITMTLLALTILLKPLAGRQSHGAVVAIAVGVPAFAIVIYLSLGSPGLASASSPHGTQTGGTTAPADSQPKAGSVSSLVDGLAARLAENPDDGEGWLLLAKSYKHLHRYDDARDAYAKAMALGVTDPSLDALADRNANVTDPDTAVAITGTVRLSAAARDIVQPTDTVFIFARAPGQAGAPAAVVQMKATAWPIEFRLTDAQSMVAGMSLSSLETVVVTARITRGGGPGEAVQGLEARSGIVPVTGSDPIDLVIQ
jgi:hypothetical protein